MSLLGVAKDGAFGAFFSGIQLFTLGHPCERIKTELQVNEKLLTIRATVKNLYSEGGIAEFYKGLRWNLYYQSGKNSFRWITVPRINQFFVTHDSSKIAQKYPIIKQTSIAITQAALETFIFSCPFEVMKIRNMTRICSKKIRMIDLVKKEGLFVLYTGGTAVFLRQMASWTSYLIAAQKISRLFSENRTFVQDFVINSLAGGVNVFLKAPFDTVKAQLQKEGPIQISRTDLMFMHLIREHGMRRLWKGSGVSLIHSMWFSGVMFTSMKYLNIYDVTK